MVFHRFGMITSGLGGNVVEVGPKFGPKPLIMGRYGRVRDRIGSGPNLANLPHLSTRDDGTGRQNSVFETAPFDRSTFST
jgi:hypothetical protein